MWSLPSSLGHESSLSSVYPVNHLVAALVISSTVRVLQFLCSRNSVYLILAPEHESSDACNSDMTKRSHKVLSLSKQVKVLDLKRKEKNHMLRSLRSIIRTNMSMNL